jgi:tRNA A-37 threonylcarbamoyl transferase component Bud32
MGVVFRVLDKSTGRTIALKRSLDNGPVSVTSLFEREYRTLVSLRHPRIIQVYDFGVDDEGSFYTMELLDGVDLRKRSPLGWREVCANLRDVASSLALLHSRRLIHRDVSPGNIRLTSEGRAKLIDFGTLTSFGNSSVVAGTPSGVAPEALGGVGLDHRTDLYALGATAYYALTGRHAYPARNLRDLGAVWANGAPPPPSSLVPGIPSELDELVLSLISLDQSVRPSSDAEVIDRLGAIAGLPPEEDQLVAESYLVSPDLVGRAKQLARLRSRLDRAIGGRGSALFVEALRGHGRSTLLRRVESDARVQGATVLMVNARAHPRPFGTCQALVERALAELPERAAFLRKVHLADSRQNSEGIERFILALTETTPVVILVDDVHAADNHSLLTLAALARDAAEHRLLILASLDEEHPARDLAALELFGRSAGHIHLKPFSSEDTEEFVGSMFGEVQSTKRLATWLVQQTAGNPSLCADLVAHLVKEGRIRYAEGTWILPHEFPNEDVEAIMTSAIERHLARLPRAQRRFAEILSLHRRSLDAELCRSLCDGDAELAPGDAARLLSDLAREDVLVGDPDGYSFARSRMREVLYDGIDEDRRRSLHNHAAKTIAAKSEGSPEQEFEVGWHLLLAGDRTHAFERIALNMMDLASRPDALVRAVPQIKDLYREYQRIGGTVDELLLVTSSLVVSGYYVDPTVHDEFGDVTAEQLQKRTGFALAGRIAPYVGSYPAVLVGLLWGVVKYAWGARTLRVNLFQSMVLLFVGVCAARSAVAYLRLEPKAHEHLLRLLSPAKGLSRHNAVRLVYDLIAIAFAESRGAIGDAHDGYQDQLARLPKVPLFIDEARHHYEAGLLCSLGRCHLFRFGSGALECADRVDALGGQHDRILAQFLRHSFHLYRGETRKAEEAEKIVDAMAGEYGYRWVPDILAVQDFVPYHLSADVVGLKRVLYRTERVLTIAPSFTLYREVIRAMYEGHRGRPEVALGLYDELADRLRPFTHPVWSFAHAHRAECLNALGRHEEALAVCKDALQYIGAVARTYVVAYQQLERESAVALAGMGRTTEAAELLDELLGLHEQDSHPLVIGLLHRDRARVARMAGDRSAFERHANLACAQFSITDNATLVGQGRRLAELMPGRESHGREGLRPEPEPPGLLHSVAGAPPDVLARRALEHIVTLSGASRAFLYLMQNGRPTLSASHGDAAAPGLEREIGQLLATIADDSEETKTESAIAHTPGESSALTLLPLVVSRGERHHVVGAAAIYDCKKPSRLTAHHLHEMALVLQTGAVTVVERDLRRGAQGTVGG